MPKNRLSNGLELELLLQQTVPGPEQLSCSRQLLEDGSTGLDVDQWRALRALPIAIDDDHLDIAVPSHWDEQDRSEFLAQHPGNGRQIRLHRSLESDLKAALQKTETRESVEPVPTASPSVDRAVEETAATYLEEFTVDGVLEEDPEEQAEQSSGTIDLEASLRDADASPVVSLVDRILLQAMSVGASDIHVEPQQKGLRLRYRQDGVLQQYIEPLPGRLIPCRHLPLQDPGGPGHRRTTPGSGRTHPPQVSRPSDRLPGQHPAEPVTARRWCCVFWTAIQRSSDWIS